MIQSKINKGVIKDFLKDHRFMSSVIAALTFGGSWTMHVGLNQNVFSRFLNIINKIKKMIKEI